MAKETIAIIDINKMTAFPWYIAPSGNQKLAVTAIPLTTRDPSK
jgi:hypothetical protein